LGLFGFDKVNQAFPTYIGLYTGLSFTNTETLGGYGWPTTGSYDLDVDGWLTFGAIYQDVLDEYTIEKPHLSTMSIDYNEQNCADRYLIASVIPTSGDAALGTIGLEFRSNDIQTAIDLSAPTPPS